MKELLWTSHAKMKMRYYGLSETRVKRVLRNPERVEEGIADNTVAMMQLGSTTAKNPYEIWMMISKDNKKNTRVISAWKYPGRTKAGEPLPKAILRELREAI